MNSINDFTLASCVGEKDNNNCIGDDGKVYLIPRGAKPVNEYANPSHIISLYPYLFPYGVGAIEDLTRPVHVGYKDHVRYLLSMDGKRFERNHSFLYVCFNILQKRNACYQARLMISRPYFVDTSHQIDRLSQEDIQSALVDIENKQYNCKNHARLNILLKQLRTVGGNVMGSQQSRALLRYDIHALIYSLGLPSVFITINPADINHPVTEQHFCGSWTRTCSRSRCTLLVWL
jgi:hypothetical protein